MSGKRAGGSSKVVGALAGAAAAFVARKVLFFGWKKVTGKEPPEHPEDPQVALTEALIWGMVMGAGWAGAAGSMTMGGGGTGGTAAPVGTAGGGTAGGGATVTVFAAASGTV